MNHSTHSHKNIRIGQVYGSWSVVELPVRVGKYYKVLCVCKCGETKLVDTYTLLKGKTKSCGKGSCKVVTKTHDKSSHALYSVHANILNRTHNPTGSNLCYEGIEVCDEWSNNFMSFYDWAMRSGYRKGLSIDRINRAGNYTPDNCRWVDVVVQSQNRGVTRRSTTGYKGVYKEKRDTLRPYYFIVIYKGCRYSKYGFISAEEARESRAKYVADNYPELVYID